MRRKVPLLVGIGPYQDCFGSILTLRLGCQCLLGAQGKPSCLLSNSRFRKRRRRFRVASYFVTPSNNSEFYLIVDRRVQEFLVLFWDTQKC